jgi:hypothetical protein
LIFDCRQDTKQGGPGWSKTAIRCKLPVLQQGHWDKKNYFLLFVALLPVVFLVKSLVSPVSNYYSKNRNDGS